MGNRSVPIRVLNEDISNFHHWRETVKSFTDLTGIQVELEYQWLNDYWATIISAYTDRAGEFDVVATDEMLLPLYARRGAVLPLFAARSQGGRSRRVFRRRARAVPRLTNCERVRGALF